MIDSASIPGPIATQNEIDHKGKTVEIGVPRMKNIGMCQMDHMPPSTRLDVRAFRLASVA